MYRRVAICLALVACGLQATSLSCSAEEDELEGLPVSVNVNVADVMRQIGDGIAYVLSRQDDHDRGLVKQSLPQIQVDLSRLAAAKKSVIAVLREALDTTSEADRKANVMHLSKPAEQRLTDGYSAIRESMRGLNADLRRLDPDVGAKDTSLTEALFARVMSQGALTNDLGQLMNVQLYPAGENYDAISNRDKVAAFVKQFDTVRDIEQLNARISTMRKTS
jgi:hypothetical protein